MRRLRKETPALHPAHGKSLKPVRRESACGTCARTEPRQRYPTRGSRIAFVHRLPPFL
nr:MAG TPA: hypothetical protein [Bacteriophage sp.]